MGEGRQDQRRIGERRQVDEPDAIRELVRQVRGDGECETRLASAPGSRQRDQPGALLGDKRLDKRDIVFPTNEWGELKG
jgi:hypothetical protein